MTMQEECAKMAAIVMDKSVDLNGLIAHVRDHMRANSVRVQGYIQREIAKENSCRCHTFLENLMSGKQVQISQDLGNGAIGCKLDASMLSQLSTLALQELDLKPQLLIINRFGRGEFEGHGFRNVFEKAIAMDIPVLTAVKSDYLAGWREFSGEFGDELNPNIDDIIAWCDRAIRASSH